MFKKCLKYDLKSIWSTWWIFAVAVLGIGLVGCVSLRFFIEMVEGNMKNLNNVTGGVLEVLLVLTFAIAVFVVISFAALTPILVFIRFYKNFFTDEGYLTFTLPVPRRTLYLSKTVSAMIWSAASLVVVSVIALFGMLVIPAPCNAFLESGLLKEFHTIVGPFDLVAFNVIGNAVTEAWQVFGGWTIVYGLEAVTGIVLVVLFEMGVIQMCITIGSVLAKRHKLIASIGIYFGVNSAISTAFSILLTLSEFTMLPGLDYIISESMTPDRLLALAAVLLLVILIVGAVLCSVVHFIALGNVERRLNLS